MYWKMFVVLFVLTVLEVGVVKVPGIAKGPMILALVMFAVVKAALVGLFFMHLAHETKPLKATIAIPLCVPAFYAVVLISEAAWRLL
jgi:caa(3)-type oxidase subunit IV